jgi:hypothetical protein
MNVLVSRELPNQQSADTTHPSQGVSQFKTPLKLPSGVQSDQFQAQDQRYAALGSTASRKVSQFKAPLRRESGVQSDKLLAQDRPYSASGTSPFNGALLFQVTNPKPPVVHQTEKQVAQSGYHVPSGMHLSNAALQHSGLTMSLPRVLALPSVATRDTYSAGVPITGKSGVLAVYPKEVSTDPYVGIPAPLSSLEALRQRGSSQFMRGSDRSWRPALTEAQRRIKTPVTMKVILMGGTALLVGGIASFLLLRFPTYLVVTWAILIIVFSNLISRELRSYYRLTPTTLSMEAVHPSTISTPQGEDTGRHPMLKDIGGTTDYLKALCMAFKDDHSAQTFSPERDYRV